ncbi:MAG: hypothetical protein R3290_04395 [Acidimicrobiia bacterium]|nr:hypothetical protein [Acidimicrobiia bacterium]
MTSVAVVCSAHGLGHLTRSLELAAGLRRAGASVTLFTASPGAALAWDPGLEVVAAQPDVGFVQTDGITEDVAATLRLLEERCDDAAIDVLAGRLAPFDLVVADTPPTALEAARRAGVPAVAVGNFDWASIYAAYAGLEAWSRRFAAWQAHHPGIRLWPGPGLHGFASVRPVGLLARRSPAVALAPKTVLVAFSAHGLPGGPDLLPRMPGVTWVVDDDFAGLRPDFEAMDRRPFPGLVAGAGAVLTKPGYGIVAEALACGARLAWIPRGRFPEAASLEEVLRGRGDPAVEAMTPEAVGRAVAEALGAAGPAPLGDPDEGDRVAAEVLRISSNAARRGSG